MAIKRLLEDCQDSQISKKICYYHRHSIEEKSQVQELVEDQEIEEDPEEYEPDEEEYQEPKELSDDEEHQERRELSDEEELIEEHQERKELSEDYDPQEEEEETEIPTTSTTPERDIHNDYSFIKNLGEGGFGTVLLCQHNISRQFFACKMMSKEDYRNHHHFTQEVDFLRHLSPNPGVIGFKDVYEDSDWMYLILEYCPNGDLHKYMEKATSRPSESELAIKFKGLVETLCYCHDKGVVHRDIKTDNILLTESKDFVLADFGLSTRIPNSHLICGVVGTTSYIPPEMLTNYYYTEKVDVWSAGILLCNLLTGEVPFRGNTETEIFEAIVEQNINFNEWIWNKVSMQGKDLVSSMLTKDPNRRPSAKEVLTHPWFTTVFHTLEKKPVKAKLRGCGPITKRARMARKQQQLLRCCGVV